jgi:hypothetical protein
MDPLSIALGLGSGLASIAGGVMGNAGSAKAAKEQFRDNSNLMAQQYDYNRSARETAYQDETVSMKAAGLNPMLAFMQQPGSASVGLPSVSQAPYRDPISPALSTAKDAFQAGSQNQLNAASADAAKAQAAVNTANAGNADALAKARIAADNASAGASSAQANQANEQARLLSGQADYVRDNKALMPTDSNHFRVDSPFGGADVPTDILPRVGNWVKSFFPGSSPAPVAPIPNSGRSVGGSGGLSPTDIPPPM